MTEVDDIQSFIAAQKRRIEEERAGLLNHGNVGGRNVGHFDSHKLPQDLTNNNTNVRRQVQPKVTVQDVTRPSGLAPLGSYESVQERLRKERAEEYKKYLAEKHYHRTGEKLPGDQVDEKSSNKGVLHTQDDNQGLTPRDSRKTNQPTLNEQQRKPSDGIQRNRPRGRPQSEKTMDELYDAYEELLERKRQDERRYRGVADDSFLDPRRVKFDDESKFKPVKETWIENGSRRRWETLGNPTDHVGRRGFRETEIVTARPFDDNQERTPRNKNQNPEEDRVSRSAPPTAVPLFGEHDMTPEKKQQRQAKYREELQAQMKEKEMQKKREKSHTFIADPQKEEPNSKNSFQTTQNPIAQGYFPSYPRHDNPAAPPLTQRAFEQPSGNHYLSQPYIYSADLLSSGPPHSTLNGPSGLQDRYQMSLREPYGSYQPSWADDPVRTQQTSGLVTSIGQIGGERSMENRHGQSTGREQRTYGDLSGGIGVLPHSDASRDKERDRQRSYREELTRQMMEKEMRKKKDKEDADRYNMKLEQEITEYNPWGRGGGGAPIKDVSGRLVSDLRKMHQYNVEGTIISPRDQAAKPDLNKEVGRFTSDVPSVVNQVTLQEPVRLPVQTEEPQKKVQLEYQDFLRQQVEEKQRNKKEEEERVRELDARQDKVIEEQQLKLRNQYEKEIEATKQKEEAARLKNDEIRQAAEQKKKEIDRKKLEEERKQEERLRKQLDERLKAAKAKDNAERSASPPLPALQGQARSSSPPIPTLQRKGEEETRSSPPIPSLQNQVRSNSPPIPTLQRNKPDINRQTSVDRTTPRPSSSRSRSRQQADNPTAPSLPATPKPQGQRKGSAQDVYRSPSVAADIDVLSQLTSLRRQLKNEEIKVQQQLSENKEKYVKLRENSASRRVKKPTGNVFDNDLRKNPTVSQKDQDLKSFGAMTEFNQLKYEDTSSLHGDFISRYPDPATTSSTLDLQQKSLLREQQKRLEAFRDTLHSTDKENIESLGNNRARPVSNTSQLESDSQFVSVEDPSKIVVAEPSKQSSILPSARERRRWKQLQQLSKSSKLSDYSPPTPGGFSMNSVTSFNVDEVAQKNEERLRRLEAMKQARSESKSDPNEVLKKFIQQHSRPDSKVSENSLPADKRYFPNP